MLTSHLRGCSPFRIVQYHAVSVSYRGCFITCVVKEVTCVLLQTRTNSTRKSVNRRNKSARSKLCGSQTNPLTTTSLSHAPVQVYDGGYHALHHDLPEVAESVLKEVTTWITQRLPATTSQEPQGS